MARTETGHPVTGSETRLVETPPLPDEKPGRHQRSRREVEIELEAEMELHLDGVLQQWGGRHARS